MSFHKILEKQINKYLPEQYRQEKDIAAFLSTISDYYTTFDRDKKIAEHAFAISEREYQEVVAHLKEQNEVKHKTLLQLKEAVSALDQGAKEDFNFSNDDIFYIIDFLKDQIAKSKEIERYLMEAKDSAENASRAKSDFLSVMSHEIRTPLNAIIGYIHLLINENPLPTQVEFLNILQISARNLLSLINDVLDFSKIEEGKIIFAESDFDVRMLLNDIKLANKIRAEENNNIIKVMFDEDIPRFLKGDITRITQIMNNLVSNAIKFTKDGRITIELQLKSTTGNRVEINFSVADNGIGISEENQKHIFEKFTQAHKYITREFGGSGLGLAIIKKLLQLLNSEIYVESQPGKGSNFYFSVWFEKSDITQIADAPKDESKEKLGGLKILLVEDVEFNSILAKKMLTNWGAEVSVAENGLKAIDKVRTEKFDLILMDVQMPVMDGLTASREIRKFNKEIPIFPLTASTSAKMQEEFKEMGISDFIFKPINPDNLHRTILKQLYKKGQ